MALEIPILVVLTVSKFVKFVLKMEIIFVLIFLLFDFSFVIPNASVNLPGPVVRFNNSSVPLLFFINFKP